MLSSSISSPHTSLFGMIGVPRLQSGVTGELPPRVQVLFVGLSGTALENDEPRPCLGAYWDNQGDGRLAIPPQGAEPMDDSRPDSPTPAVPDEADLPGSVRVS